MNLKVKVKAARHQARYDDVAERSGIFPSDAVSLRRPPLQQLWLDHLLALAMMQAEPTVDAARFVVCAPVANVACTAVVESYRSVLLDPTTFGTLTLDDLDETLSAADIDGATQLQERYVPWNEEA